MGGREQAGPARSADAESRVPLLGGVFTARRGAGERQGPPRLGNGRDGDVARRVAAQVAALPRAAGGDSNADGRRGDRKSTRLNSSHRTISYAVFCLKKKTKN